MREFLAPLEATARLCRMEFLEPWVTSGTHRLDPPEIEQHARRYGEMLAALCEDGAPASVDASVASGATA